jgi:putative DNA primase/helicase
MNEAPQSSRDPRRQVSRTCTSQRRNGPRHAGRGIADDSDPVTEDSVAAAFASKYGGLLKFCHHAGKWHRWDGAIWRQEETRLALDLARELSRDLAASTAKGTMIVAAGRAAFASGVERLAQADRAFALTGDAWNRDPWLLGTPKGTVDLRTGELRAPRQEDLISRSTAVGPADRADCPAWLSFLDQATDYDAELVAFLQRWCGYCLTGDTREHALLFGYGPGGNGKSVFLNTVAGILGDYHKTAAMDVLTDVQGSQHKAFIAMLHGARLVTAAETEEGRAWAETKLKELTGGTEVTANFMRRDPFSFVPQFKITITGNHKPILKNPDEAMRRRLNIVPFIHQPAHPDLELETKLRAEWPGILRWMIEGCLAWQREGLKRPKVVVDATAEYFAAQDYFGRWLAECCILDSSLSAKPGTLLASFKRWCEANGEPLTDNRRLRGMIERTKGLHYVTNKGTQLVRGIGLRPDDAPGWGGGVGGSEG